MRQRYVLCRWPINEIGEPRCYCAKPIQAGAWPSYCAAHLMRLPFWPTDEPLDGPA